MRAAANGNFGTRKMTDYGAVNPFWRVPERARQENLANYPSGHGAINKFIVITCLEKFFNVDVESRSLLVRSQGVNLRNGVRVLGGVKVQN